MRTEHLKVSKSARIALHGDDGADYQIMALHGYGQLASYHIRKYIHLKHAALIVPEGLSSFYTQGTSGRVGASWMTKHDRLTEIEDYINYLDQVHKTYCVDTKPLIISAFSQGCATAMRWLAAKKPKIESLLLWAGDFPLELIDDGFVDYLNGLDIHYLLGDHDQYVSVSSVEKHLEAVRQYNINVSLRVFSGDHRVQPQILSDLLET